jgi:hypothetical protein
MTGRQRKSMCRGQRADHRDNQPTYLSARQPRRKRPTHKTTLVAGHDHRARPTGTKPHPRSHPAKMSAVPWTNHPPPPTPDRKKKQTSCQIFKQYHYHITCTGGGQMVTRHNVFVIMFAKILTTQRLF